MVMPAEIPDQVETDHEIGQRLLAEHEAFNERFTTSPHEGIEQRFYHSEEWRWPVLQRNIPVEDGLYIMLHEPTILSESEDESDEPFHSGLPFVFEMSLAGDSRHEGIPEWTIVVYKDGTYETNSIAGRSREWVADEAIRNLRNLA